MKTDKLFFLFSILLSMLETNASAYDIAVENADGVTIYYNYTNNNTEVEVTYKTENDYNDYGGSVVIPNEVTYNDKTLKVTSIGDCPFRDCSALTSIIVEKKNSKYDSRNNCNAIIETNSNKLIMGCKNTVIPNNVTSIECGAFDGMKDLKNITIPNSVTSIGGSAFFGCSSLESVTLPNSVTSIGDYVFWGCSSLQSVTLPNSVTSIGGWAFHYCVNLESITIPNSVTSIGDCVFWGCSSLQSVTLPNSLTSIGEAAFCECRSLESITIPNSVTSIGEYAFSANNLNKVTSKIAKPFAINDETFSSTAYSSATLYVPKGTVDKYKATDGWKNFKNIVEEDSTTAINNVEADNTLNTANAIYDTNGKRLPVTSLDELPSGLYIINGKKVVK